MARERLSAVSDEIHGATSPGHIHRVKRFRDARGRIIGVGVQETYEVKHPRNYKRKPALGEEKANQDLFKQASIIMDKELSDPKQYEYWQKRFEAQLYVTRGGYLAALWWCYGKSDNEKSPNAMRYIALAATLLSAAALIVSINSDFAWWFEFPNVLIYASYYQMAPFYHLLFACIAACILIGLYDCKPNTQPEITNKDKKRTKRILCAGWILLGTFIVELTFVLSLVDRHSLPEWLEMTITLFIFAAPLIAGIYLIIACRALRKAYDMLEQSSKSDNQ